MQPQIVQLALKTLDLGLLSPEVVCQDLAVRSQSCDLILLGIQLGIELSVDLKLDHELLLSGRFLNSPSSVNV